MDTICAWPWTGPGSYDFRKDGPPLWTCSLCGREFRLWMVAREYWLRIPSQYHGLVLCEDEYRRLLSEAGHDPGSVQVHYDAWDRTVAEWKMRKNLPPDWVHVGFDRETMWCRVLRRTRRGGFVVRADNVGVTVPIVPGDEIVATWEDEMRHRRTGRPVLRAIRRVGGRRTRSASRDAGQRYDPRGGTMIEGPRPAGRGRTAR